MDASRDPRGRDERVRARRRGGGARGRPHGAGGEPRAGSAREDRHTRGRPRDVASDRPPAAEQGETGAGPLRARALGGFHRPSARAGAAGGRGRRGGAGGGPGGGGGGGAREPPAP